MKCALPSCLVHVLVGYTDSSRPFQVNEETILRSRKQMGTVSGSAVPVLRYFCSQAHCDKGKEEHEVTLKEYNSELARKEMEQKIADVEEDLKCEQKNHELSTATTSSATDQVTGPVKTPTEHPEHPKGRKEEGGGKMDSATARGTVTATGASGGTLKQGGVSLTPTLFDDPTGLCSHPGCSQPGTKFCASCKTTAYCSAECQMDDWPRHKESCEGRLLKMGKHYLDKAKDCCRDLYWSNAIKHCDAALTKLNHMNKPPRSEISEVRWYQRQALEALDRCALELFIAAAHGDLTKVEQLLKQGADKDKPFQGSTPLYIAAQNGHLPVVRYLAEQGADKGKTDNNDISPLYAAIEKGHLGVVRCLVEQGVDKDKANKFGATPLFQAVLEHRLDVVKLLVELGADVDKTDNDGHSPLFIAASSGWLAMVQCFVENGADKDKANIVGRSPLNIAARRGRTVVVKYLLQQGADMDKASLIEVAANKEIKDLINDEEKRLKKNKPNCIQS